MEIERDWDTGRTNREEIEFLRARVAVLESELSAERVLHGAGKCTCHLEGTCIWCRWVAAQERVEALESAAKRRPMSEAIDDGTWVLVKAANPDATQPFDVLRCIQGNNGRAWIDESGNPYFTESQWSEWYPLPDQRVEVEYATARDMAVNDELGEGN